MSRTPLLALIAAALLCAAPPASAQQAQADFPDGPGKQTFVNLCGACHDINRVRAGYTPEGWRTVMRMMLNFDVPVPKDEVEPLTQYLIKNFPERPRPAAVIIAGVDCGFGTFAGRLQVDSKIVWMKLASLAEGARLASKELW